MPPEGPPGTDAFKERIRRSLQAAQKEGSGQGAARFLIVSILKSRIPGRAAMPSAGHGAILRFRSKKSGRIRAFRLQISSQNCQNSAPPEAPCCTLHFVLRFPVIPRMCCPLLRSCIRRRIPEPDPGSRFFSSVRYVMCGRSRVLHLRYFLRRPKGQRLPRSCHLRSCNSQQKALSRTAFAMERSGRYSGISIAWVA